MRLLLIVLVLSIAYSPTAVAKGGGFDETHSDMFVFVEKSESLRQYGYSGFCKTTKTFACSPNLKYRKYLGKRGYFVSMEPVTERAGYEFREVLLETGEKFYFVAKPYKGNILGVSNGDIAFVRDIESTQSEVGRPIVDGSPVTIIRASSTFNMPAFYINDEEPFDAEELKIVRALLSSLNTRAHDKELLEILQVSSIEWDRIEQRYIFRIAPFHVDGYAGPVQATVIKAKKSLSLTGSIRYYADDWLFVDRYVVVAGDLRYESPSLEFRRDHSGGKIWEWTRFSVDSEKRRLLDAVAAESDAVVRFYGRDYYNDKEMSAAQRDGLQKMLRLYDLLLQVST